MTRREAILQKMKHIRALRMDTPMQKAGTKEFRELPSGKKKDSQARASLKRQDAPSTLSSDKSRAFLQELREMGHWAADPSHVRSPGDRSGKSVPEGLYYTGPVSAIPQKATREDEERGSVREEDIQRVREVGDEAT